MYNMLKIVNQFHSVVNILYVHPVRFSTTNILNAAANSNFLSNNQAGEARNIFQASKKLKIEGISLTNLG